MDALVIDGLSKIYGGSDGIEAVRGINLKVRQGEVFGLLGPNGAGKTTTIGMCTTRVIPTAGRATISGLDVVGDPVGVRRQIGVVPQFDTLDRSCTVAENLVYHCRYFGMSRRDSKLRAAELLDQFRLSEKANSTVASLSGGMSQRLRIARAIAHRPAVLFLDEPTSGLDPQSRIALWELLTALNSDGTTIILTTHFMEEADQLCSRLAIMDHGQILVCDTPSALKRRSSAGTSISLDLSGDRANAIDRITSLAVASDVRFNNNSITFHLTSGDDLALSRVMDVALEYGLMGLTVTEPNLEMYFIELTGHALRD